MWFLKNICGVSGFGWGVGRISIGEPHYLVVFLSFNLPFCFQFQLPFQCPWHFALPHPSTKSTAQANPAINPPGTA